MKYKLLDENETIICKWNNGNKKYYINKGYKYTKNGDEFKVFIKDLTYGSGTRVRPYCDYCGAQYETPYSVYIKGHKIIAKDCCSKCTGKKTSEVTRKKRAEKYIAQAQKRCEQLGYHLITTVNDFTEVKMQIKIDIGDGNIQEVMLSNFLRGHDCFVNSYKDRRFNRISVDKIENIISNDGNKWLNSDEYRNCTDRNLKIKCKCGNMFQTSFVNYYKAKVNRCPICTKAKSKGEILIENVLKDNNIDYIFQHKFDDCRDKRKLPFDFYLPKYNACIEFDGQGHYTAIYSDSSLEATVRHDNIKNAYCNKKGISLLRIPYFDCNDVEKKIKNFIINSA